MWGGTGWVGVFLVARGRRTFGVEAGGDLGLGLEQLHHEGEVVLVAVDELALLGVEEEVPGEELEDGTRGGPVDHEPSAPTSRSLHFPYCTRFAPLHHLSTLLGQTNNFLGKLLRAISFDNRVWGPPEDRKKGSKKTRAKVRR